MDVDSTEIIAIISVFGMPVLIVLIVALFYFLRKRSMYHAIEVMVENGHQVPPQMFEQPEGKVSSIRMLRNGLMCIVVGIGMALLAWAIPTIELAAVASVPVLVGVAYVIVSRVAKKKEEAEATADAEDSTSDC